MHNKSNKTYEKLFDCYNDYGSDYAIFPARGVSYLKDKSPYYNVLIEGLEVNFVRNTKISHEATELRVGDIFIGWMPKEMAKVYIDNYINTEDEWYGIIKHLYNSPDLLPGVRIALHKRSNKEKIEENKEKLVNAFSKKENTNINIENINTFINAIQDMRKNRSVGSFTINDILNGIYNMGKEGINLENVNFLLKEDTAIIVEEKERNIILKKLQNIYFSIDKEKRRMPHVEVTSAVYFYIRDKT